MKYWIWYSILKTLTERQKRKLLEIYKNPNKIFMLSRVDLENLNFLSTSNINEILENRNATLLKQYEDYIKSNNIYLLNITDEKYPLKLKNIYDPPITLFLKGNVNLINEFSIAIIGCREATYYGMNIAKRFSRELAEKGVVIISGMAKGIDGVAHIGALDANGKTIAVLGSGVDYPYPLENIKIYKEILNNNGLIISEYIVGTKPNAINFPKRNRIIRALSNGVLVIEAKKKSGTMITVDFALEQGKEVYVVPGDIDRENSQGTNDLIKQGAKLVSNIEEILEDFII